MAITKFTTNVENIQALSDKPNEVEGLTADELKAKWDKAGEDIKTYLNDTLTDEIDDIWKTIYPIGAIYLSVVNTSPATLFGGTWSAFGAGKTLVGLDSEDADFDTSEKTGGAKTHTLTTAQMPTHTHTQNAHSHFTGNPNAGGSAGWYSTAGNAFNSTAATTSTTAVNQNTGGGEAHPNLQPYITVYMWKRTA